MENSSERVQRNGPIYDGHDSRNSPYETFLKGSLPWLYTRVFYVRVSEWEIDDSTPEYLILNHIPLDHHTLLELNGVRSSIDSDGVSTLLRRDRLDKKSEEATFVGTDCIRMTGNVKFEVLDKGVLLLSGVLELSTNVNGFIGEPKDYHQGWRMNCESHLPAGVGFLKGKQYMGHELTSPIIEVYVAGCFSGNPIILTKTLRLSSGKRKMRKGMLDSIPKSMGSECPKNFPSGVASQIPEYPNDKGEDEDNNNLYSRTECLEGEDGELLWFNAGVRVGVGIGLGVFLGLGIAVGLLARAYQGTTRNFRHQRML
ncbi:uncharacterized protein At1g01500-like [Malania oleifera]|uniref:uncharacterized protein At1g01500-like n=1 Tax=Malania oleifera TaxID=397392 RepID=UPI0025AE1AE1|nr:uncharacterized protein At1g01500-like [Malania oleifera]XP_057965723.1 uncharacterized protein At1g01500-like [Malania oleifera]